MTYKKRVPFSCDECGERYDPLYEQLRIGRAGLDFHLSVSRSGRPVNYCRPCLANKLRLLANELADEWPDEILWQLNS